jgi:hypothetical protein
VSLVDRLPSTPQNDCLGPYAPAARLGAADFVPGISLADTGAGLTRSRAVARRREGVAAAVSRSAPRFHAPRRGFTLRAAVSRSAPRFHAPRRNSTLACAAMRQPGSPARTAPPVTSLPRIRQADSWHKRGAITGGDGTNPGRRPGAADAGRRRPRAATTAGAAVETGLRYLGIRDHWPGRRFLAIPPIAGAAMVASSVTVVSNALRLRRFRLPVSTARPTPASLAAPRPI